MGKILITGTGRAGTTFLIQLLTALDMDTGFKNPNDGFDKNKRAGMEPPTIDVCLSPDSPKISKTPAYCNRLQGLLEKGLQVEHVIIPVRKLSIVAESRIKTGLKLDNAPEDRQKDIAAQRLGELMETVILEKIPYTFLIFPQLALDRRYLFDKLSPIFGWAEKYYPRFENAFKDWSRPEMIVFK